MSIEITEGASSDIAIYNGDILETESQEQLKCAKEIFNQEIKSDSLLDKDILLTKEIEHLPSENTLQNPLVQPVAPVATSFFQPQPGINNDPKANSFIDALFDFSKKLKYEASLAYTKFYGEDNWWTKIEPLKLYLGALPLTNQGHLDEIVKLGVTHVLSMVEDFEIEDGWFDTPVKGLDWEEHGIVTKQIKAVDFLPLKQEEIEEGVAYLDTLLEEGKMVYVHCKAGRGRSASIVIVYLMKHHGLSFDEAFAFVKEQRSQINLNNEQREAIFEYFAKEPTFVDEKFSISHMTYDFLQNVNHMSEDALTQLLHEMLEHVIKGGSYSAAEMVPAPLSAWIPPVEIQSTLERRDRYLREYRGDQVAATQAAIDRNHGLMRRFKLLAAHAIPFIGIPASHSISLWHQLREITLIAAIHGHDINDPEVKMKILSCLVGGNLLKVPAATVDLIARKIIKKVILQAGAGAVLPVAIPTHLIFNFFTDNSAKVSTHAKEVFSGENSIPISPEDYL